ncbi:DoxX family protein [Streptomyces lateritius]|uniref:DoxX family protein n=1 Tax=Streptomyces lateritius TaxID=67313 RepID=UPI00167B19E2|nr:DoxX family protein [Streptomyces lateritius]GGT67422.1 membrane protein [Streptomyces lateritius]
MSTPYVVVTAVAAFMVGFSALSVFIKAPWVAEPLTEYGVPRTWWTRLGVAKAAGAAGLVVGLWVPAIGLAAGTATVLYFAGAVVTVIRARSYPHVAWPLMYATPVVAALVLA